MECNFCTFSVLSRRVLYFFEAASSNFWGSILGEPVAKMFIHNTMFVWKRCPPEPSGAPLSRLKGRSRAPYPTHGRLPGGPQTIDI